MTAVRQDARRAASAVRGGEARAARVESRTWFRVMARAGIAARGVIYVMLTYFSAEIALRGSSPEPTSGEGAIAEVAHQPAGPALVAVLAVGLGGYGIWRGIEAFSGRERPGRRRNLWVRLGWLVICGIYLALCGRAVALLVGGRGATSGGSSRNAQAWAGRVLALPGGQAWLAMAGIGLLIGGISLAVWGIAHDYRKELRLDRLPRRVRALPRVLGGIGDTSRGGLLCLVGLYLLDAAVDGRSSPVKTTDLALRSLAHQPYGTAVIAVLAAGLVCFAIESFLEAWLRDL